MITGITQSWGEKCFTLCPYDTATALAALDAKITIFGSHGERSIAVKDFYNPLGTALRTDEMIKEIAIPRITSPAEQRVLKFTFRKDIDFTIVSVAAVINNKDGICTDARIALGAVAAAPVRAKAAEEVLIGRPIDETVAAEAGERSLADARPLSRNAHKIEITKVLVRRAILSEERTRG